MRSLRTERLELQPCRAGDVDALHALWTDPDVRRFLWDDLVISREQAAEVVQAFVADGQSRGLGLWKIFEQREGSAAGASSGTRGSGPLIGFCALREIAGTSEIELFYGLAPAGWGRGLATEAARAVLGYGFEVLGLERIWARTDPPNLASQRVMQRLSMRPSESPAAEGPASVDYVLERGIFLQSAQAGER